MALTKEQLDWVRKMSGKTPAGHGTVVTGDAMATVGEDSEFLQSSKGGMKDVAGMGELKHMVTDCFINVLKNRKMAARFGIQPPAMLLYGPSGCGKTFFAMKMAEELDIYFMKVTPDDLASTMIHGTQQKIGEVFHRAENNAPTLLFFDEFDCMVPKRSGNESSQHTNSEVNEFLCRMDNAADRGVYVIAATNYPELIDRAVLRTGRIDEIIYVDMPDCESRESLLRLELDKLPVEPGIDLKGLAEKAEGLNCSDISYVVKRAAREMFNRSIADPDGKLHRITGELLDSLVGSQKPSVNSSDMQRYRQVRESFTAGREGRQMNKIGFR